MCGRSAYQTAQLQFRIQAWLLYSGMQSLCKIKTVNTSEISLTVKKSHIINLFPRKADNSMLYKWCLYSSIKLPAALVDY